MLPMQERNLRPSNWNAKTKPDFTDFTVACDFANRKEESRRGYPKIFTVTKFVMSRVSIEGREITAFLEVLSRFANFLVRSFHPCCEHR